MPKAFLVKKTGRTSGGRASPNHANFHNYNDRDKEKPTELPVSRLTILDKHLTEEQETKALSVNILSDVASRVTRSRVVLLNDRWRLNRNGSGETKDGSSTQDTLSPAAQKAEQDGGRQALIYPLEGCSKEMMIKRFLIGSDEGPLTQEPPKIYAPFPLPAIQECHGLPSGPTVAHSAGSPALLLQGLCRLRSKPLPTAYPSDCLLPELPCLPTAWAVGPMHCHRSPTKSPDVPFPSTTGQFLGISGQSFCETPSSHTLFHDFSAMEEFHFRKLSVNFNTSRELPLGSTSIQVASHMIPSKDQQLCSPSQIGEVGCSPDVTYRTRPEPPRFQCEACQKSYSTFNGLSKHKEFHCTTYIKKLFACPHCDSKSYASLGALKMHIRTHTLPCRCKFCGKAFSRPWLLQGHLRTHTGEKPFECPHCCRAFADRSNLRAHLQTHAEVKKYNCKSCSKTFSRMSLLLKHKENSCFRVVR